MSETHTRILKEDLQALRAIQNSTGQLSISETLHTILTNQEPVQRALTLVKLKPEDYNKLQTIAHECGFQDTGFVIHHLLESQPTTEMVTVAKVMNECVPVCLTGKPLSGKSYWVKNTLIPALKDKNPVLLIDPNHEYDMLKEIKSIRELELSSNQHARFCPSKNSLMGMMQIKSLIIELNAMIDIDEDAFRDTSQHSGLVLIFEEYHKSNWANAFLFKSRHTTRKAIIITPDYLPNIETYTVFR